jgi:hypothetical protein
VRSAPKTFTYFMHALTINPKPIKSPLTACLHI